MPAVVKARGLRAKMVRMATVLAPLAPLSSTVFLQFKQVQVPGLQRRPALKQSQYRAMHFDLGQLQPLGFSKRGPISSVAVQSISSISNLTGFGSAGDEGFRRFFLEAEAGSWSISNWDAALIDEASGDASESFILFSPELESTGERQVAPEAVLLAVEEDKVIACISRGTPRSG